MGIRVGMIGVGSFAQSFIPLFKAHPSVDEIALCDTDAAKLAENAARYDIEKTYPSLDALCDAGDMDAVAIITQNWMHAEQAIQALEAGLDVYSAVPTGVTVDEIERLVRTVERTGKLYMLGETSYYYPETIYCRDRYSEGAFGDIVYSEAEYYHDFDHGLYEVFKWRGGERWREFAGSPPMHYPTHSTSMVVSATGAYMTHVSCQGVVDTNADGLFKADANLWGNTFSNESALFRMSDGSACRINESRRIGHPGAVRMCLYGTDAGFEENVAGARWVTKDGDATVVLDDLLKCGDVPVESDESRVGMEVVTSDDGTHRGVAGVHSLDRLPKEFVGLPNGHNGSHQFLVDDFVTSCWNSTTPPNDVYAAARYALPGIVAHESAMQGGVLLEVPDFGGGA
jgi:predicted dehydrogenase